METLTPSWFCLSVSLPLSFFTCFSLSAPSAPRFIHFSELTTTSVNVSWAEPVFPNGIIESYRLIYEPSTPIDGQYFRYN